jgi:hypothetical protein
MAFFKGDMVWINRIDHFGLCGREYHPKSEDIGQLAEVVKVETIPMGDEADNWDLTILKCLTYGPDPHFLELDADFEVVKMQPARA